MKKFGKLIFGRIFWAALIILLQVAALLYLILISFGAFTSILGPHADSIFDILVATLVLLGSFFSIVYIVNTKANSSYKIAWIATVGFLSYFGIYLYLLFGNKNTTKRMKKKMAPFYAATTCMPNRESVYDKLDKSHYAKSTIKISKYLTKETGFFMYGNTETTYYPSGEEAFPHMLETLKKAKHYIFMEYFIIEKGLFWDSIVEILEQKAAEGVDVRVIYDDIGCANTLPFKYNRYLEDKGINCVVYNRFKPIVNVKVNNRDHRKIIVVDGYMGFTGGINLADEYINHIERFGYWKDNVIEVRGEGVNGLTMLFLSNWVALRDELEDIKNQQYDADHFMPIDARFKQDGFIQSYGGIPYKEEPVCKNLYIHLISHADKYVYITTPYLIIDEEIENTMIRAAKEGIDVRIIVPHIPDKKVVFGITRSYYKNLIAAGVKIYEFTPGFIHSKMFICDDMTASIGTCNLDYRSLYLHMECGLLLYKSSTILSMKDDYMKTIAQSELITKEKYKKLSRHKGLWWAILRLFAPMM